MKLHPSVINAKVGRAFNTFESRFKNIHNNKYSYDEVVYINAKTRIVITCPLHGNFNQTVGNHLLGQGCRKCGLLIMAEKVRKTTSEFIERALNIHQGRYTYEKVNYTSTIAKVLIQCTTHGYFEQKPVDHLKGRGCPKCSKTKPSDNDIIYVWLSDMVWDDKPVWKIGISSHRLNGVRTQQVAKANNLSVEEVYMWVVPDARVEERILLEKFKTTPLLTGEGKTEFRAATYKDMIEEVEWLNTLYK